MPGVQPGSADAHAAEEEDPPVDPRVVAGPWPASLQFRLCALPGRTECLASS